MYYRLVMGLKLDKDSGEEDKRGSYICWHYSRHNIQVCSKIDSDVVTLSNDKARCVFPLLE